MDTSQIAWENRLSKDTYVAVDVKKKKIVSLEVTSEEEVHDSKMLKKMVDNASSKNNNVRCVLADDAYDTKKNFQYFHDDNSIEAAIKVRKNSTGRSMGLCYTRKIAVLQQLNKDFNKWMQDSIRYGYTDGWMDDRQNLHFH
jgi:hypothetical protein